MGKQTQIKSFDSDGVLIKIIEDASFTGFTKYINGGLSTLVLKLARKIDTFDDNNDVSIGNRIKIYISDTDDDDVLVYNGMIEGQNPYLDGNVEYVEIVCYGDVTRLNRDILRTGQRTTFYTDTTNYLGTSSASEVAELSNVIRDIIDYFNTNNPDVDITYNVSGIDSISDTNQGINYKFTALTYLEAIEKCRLVAPQSWYWFVGADGVFVFSGKPGSATHNFVVGKSIKSLKVSKSLDQTKNSILVVGKDSVYYEYEDANSLDSYGRRTHLHIDTDLQDAGTMDNYGEAILEKYKNPIIKIELEIYDNNGNANGYDIESINPGDTCKITNIDDSSDLFTNNMTITQVDWTMGMARVIIEINNFDLDKFLINLKKTLETDMKNQEPMTDY